MKAVSQECSSLVDAWGEIHTLAAGDASGEAAGGAAGEIRRDALPVQARAQPIGWARLLERVFDIDLRRCPSCGPSCGPGRRGAGAPGR
jgi:hypothetical protein